MTKVTDGKQDLLKALRKRGGTARVGLLALDMEITHSSVHYYLKPLLGDGTLEVVKRGVVKLVRDPEGHTDLGGGDGGLDVSKVVKANIIEESEEKVEEEPEEEPVEEVAEEKTEDSMEEESEEGDGEEELSVLGGTTWKKLPESQPPKRKRKTRVRKLRFQDDDSVTCKFKILRNGYGTGVIELPEGTALLLYDTEEKKGLGDLTKDMEFTPSDKDKEGVIKLLEALKRVE